MTQPTLACYALAVKQTVRFQTTFGRLGWQTQRLTDNLISFVGS